MDTMADMLKRRRLANGHTQNEAALRIGVSQATYGRWEVGDATPAVRQIPRIARYLGVKPKAIVDLLMPEDEA